MEAKDRKLPIPYFVGGMPMNEVIAKRQSIRQFNPSRPVTDFELGQALWMALGINRLEAVELKFGHPANRSNPTAVNWQEIHAYVFCTDGVWEYLPESHSPSLVVEGDHRSLLCGTPDFTQDFVLDAPCSVLFVADLTALPEGDPARTMAMVDIGIACENLDLACTSLGLATVPRATMDHVGISRLLGFSPLHLPVLNNPIGHAK